jgi:hypothetical protein
MMEIFNFLNYSRNIFPKVFNIGKLKKDSMQNLCRDFGPSFDIRREPVIILNLDKLSA